MLLDSFNRVSEIERKMNNFVFSKGKILDKNEDAYFQDGNMLILSDGATDKSGKTYEGKTGGEIISQIIVSEAKKATLNGKELVEYLNRIVQRFYKENNIDVQNLINIFSGTLVIARIKGNQIIVTQVGDTSFRINGKVVYVNNKIIDRITSTLRQKFILKYGENFIRESRDFIMPILKIQIQYQNTHQKVIFNNELLESFYYEIRKNSSQKFAIEDILMQAKEDLKEYFGQDISYGTIDGRQTSERFIKEYEFDINEITSIEIFSDGYFSIPDGIHITSWEELYEKTQKEDPLKYKKYPSTKSNDDRTVLVSIFSE